MNRACQPSATCIQRSIAAAGIGCLAGRLPSPVSLFLAVHIINLLWGIHHHPIVKGLIQPIKALCSRAKAEQQPCQTPGELTMKHKAIGTPHPTVPRGQHISTLISRFPRQPWLRTTMTCGSASLPGLPFLSQTGEDPRKESEVLIPPK